MSQIVNPPIPDTFLSDTSCRLNSLEFKDGKLRVLDQLLLPHKFEYIEVDGAKGAYDVIKKMQVRGAPLIATVGALGLLVEIRRTTFACVGILREWLIKQVDYIISSRPTAVDLRNALSALRPILDSSDDVTVIIERISNQLLDVYKKEEAENRQLVWNGYQELIDSNPSKKKLRVMTICNTGSLATCSWGTALGIIRALHSEDRLEQAIALETRPYNQGIRLTACELMHGNVPFIVITDSMAAWTMKNNQIDAVLVGADHVALNGDAANKIGTYMLAVLANYHNIPFYPVVPRTSINKNLENGEGIVIEERPQIEMLKVNGSLVGPENCPVWNPAFDVTPATLITKILTDFGNFRPQELKAAVQALDK